MTSAGNLLTYSCEQWIAAPIARVFLFFSDARNLEQITPPWLHFEVQTPHAEIHAGTRLDYRLRLRGIPLRWQSEITVWEPPVRFVDRQTRGPYRAWIHEHTFEPHGEKTLARDFVQYAVPGGRLVAKLLVTPDIEKIFAYRRKRLEEIFGGVS